MKNHLKTKKKQRHGCKNNKKVFKNFEKIKKNVPRPKIPKNTFGHLNIWSQTMTLKRPMFLHVSAGNMYILRDKFLKSIFFKFQCLYFHGQKIPDQVSNFSYIWGPILVPRACFKNIWEKMKSCSDMEKIDKCSYLIL